MVTIHLLKVIWYENRDTKINNEYPLRDTINAHPMIEFGGSFGVVGLFRKRQPRAFKSQVYICFL